MSVFYNNFIRICSERDMSPSAAAEAAGMTSASVTGWSQGAKPRNSTLVKLSKCLNCDIDDLTGEYVPESKKITATKSDGYPTADETKNPLSEREELKRLIDRLTDDEVHVLLDRAKNLIFGV